MYDKEQRRYEREQKIEDAKKFLKEVEEKKK
jgi:hypothetical protein